MGGPGSGRLPKSIENAAKLAAKRRKTAIKAAVREALALNIDYTDDDPDTEVVPGLRRADAPQFFADLRQIQNRYGWLIAGRTSRDTRQRMRAEAAAARAAETAGP